MCAIEAGKRQRRVVVLEKADKPGKKIRISGGGKSNFTNLDVTPENYLSENQHFCKSALARYTQWDFMSLMTAAGLDWEEREHGQLFCRQGAQAIIDMLLSHCEKSAVEFRYNVETGNIDRKNAFVVDIGDEKLFAQSLVIATGGPSIPRMGATDYGLQVARQFGLKSIPFRPALVPFTFDSVTQKQFFAGLAGISLDASVRCQDTEFREQMLITHRGLSGPVILQISSYWRKGLPIEINLLPDLDASVWLADLHGQRTRAELKTLLSRKLPKRLAQRLCDQLWSSKPLFQYTLKELENIGRQLNAWQLMPSGTEGMRTAEVATGGVDTNELSSRTLMSKKVDGLYFIGETVDVTGHLGGFNFQWAWASGWSAGQVV